jgi:hypothetical protein
LDFRDGFRQDDDHRQGVVGGQAIAFIGAAACLLLDDTFAGDDFPQGGNDSCPPRENGFVGVDRFHFLDLRAQKYAGLRFRGASNHKTACYYDKTCLGGDYPTALLSGSGRPISAPIPHEDRAALLQGLLPVASRSFMDREVHNDPRRL